MKHKSTIIANGLCTPPCGSSHGKSTRFSLFTSLLLFFLLIVGNSAAWGRTPTIYGEGLPGLNTCSDCGDWNNNSKVMQSMGEDGYWYAEFLDVDATDNNKYRFKIAINDGDWWNGAMNSGNTNESMGNVDIVNGKDGDNQISFKMPFDGDVYIFYKSTNADNSKVWIVAVPQNVAAAPNNSNNRRLKTDIILRESSNDWTSDGIKFAKNNDATTYKHVTSYIMPAKKSTETGAIRFEMWFNEDTYISGKSDGRPATLSNSTPRRIIYMWDGNNHNNNTDNNNVGWISYTLPTYPMRKSGWKLFVKDYNSGNPTTMDANGSATLTLNGGSSYEFFIANTDYATNLSTYSQSAAATYPAVHSVNWFGGCYIDQSNSSNVTFNDIQVYKSDKLGTLTHPVVDSHHLQGKFQVSGSGSKDVTFTFDGGKITINAVDHEDALSGNFYVYGAGSNAQNWVTGWSSTDQGGGISNPANQMTITSNVARKTYYGVKGDNLEFKVSDGTNDVGTWSNYSTSKQNGVSASANNQNIRFSLSNASDVIVCYDGTDVWLEVKERQKPNDAWRVTGTFNGWSKDNDQMLDDATNRCKKLTLTNVNKAYDKNGHGWIKFKIFKGTDWGDNIHYDNATIIGLDGTVIGTVSDDNESDDHRILVQVDAASDITFCYYTYSDGTNIVTIKRTAYVAPVVSGIDYDGTEYIFMDRRQMGFSDNIAMSDATCWIEFSNGSESAGTQYAAFMSDDNTLASLAPAGTWTKVRVARGGQDAFTTEWGTSSWLDIDTKEKNYITQNIGGWSTYTFPNSRFFVATPQDINNPTGSWNWNGDGTLRTNSYTKTLAANELFIFKLTRDYTRARANVRWSMEGNYTHYNSSSSNLSNTECSNINNNQIKVQLDHKADVTISWLNYGDIIITQVPYYNVTFDSDGGSAMAAQELRSGEYATDPGTPSRGSGYTFNFWKLSGESSAYDFSTPVTSDIELVADWTAPTMHTVTFNTDGGSTIDEVQVAEGTPVAQPADPTKSGYNFAEEWQLGGSTYNFESPVMNDIELVAVWSFKAIESVNLNKSTLILYENSDPQTLTPSYLPADVLGVTYDWNVTPAGVVTVVNGVVNVVAPGTATITCTATDAESNSQNATCSVTVHEGEGCEMEEQSIFSHVIFGNSTTGGSASNNLLDQEALNPGMESTCRTIKMYYNGLTSEFTADEAGVVKAKSGLSDNSDVWYEIKGGSNANSYDGNFYYLKNVATGGYITRGDGIYGGNDDWKFYTTVTTPTNGKTNLYQFIYAKKDNQDNQKRICSVWNYNGTGSNQTYGLHRRNQDWADNYGSNCPNPMIVFGRGVNQGNQTLSVNFTVVATGVANPDYLSTPIVYDTRSYYRFSADAAVSLTLDKKLRAEDKVVVYCYNPSNAASNGALYINNNKVSDIQITANSALAFEYLTVVGDAGYNTIEVKSDDSNFCMASIEVLRSLPVIEQDPQLTWSAPATYYTTVAAGNFTFEASSAKSLGAIAYISSDETVATVANGVVTPVAVGTAHITASIEQYNCFGERSISYDVVVELPLQDAIDANSSLTLLHDYAENVVINKAITIDGGGHSIGNLKVENEGDLTLSGALTVNDFSIYAQAGNTTTPAASGQVRNATNLTVNGNAYFFYTVEPGEHVQYGWYDFTVPFPVNTASGIKGIQDEVLKETFAYGTDYAILAHYGDKHAQGEYPYKKFQGVMQPCRLYSITLDDDFNYKTLRFQKTNDGALVAGDNVTLHEYTGEVSKDNWNGVGNGTLHHANVGVSTGVIQVYQSGNNSFMAVNPNEYSLVIGSAFMVQEAGTMTLNQATHDKLLAPRRAASVQPTAIQIASEGKPFSDQLFISADELAGQGYTQGVDVAKAGNIGNVNVPQIWTNAYNTSLCAHEAQLINGEAQYTLSLYAPANGTYTLTSKHIPADYTLYLTQNGNKLWDLSDPCTLDLTKGTTTEYGLLLVESYKMPTGVEQVQGDKVQGTKVLRNGILYILRNGKVFNAQGARVR